MTHFEMVEKLREKTHVSYEEAKAALEAADWDLLDAMVLLEKEGHVQLDASDEGDRAEYSTRKEKQQQQDYSRNRHHSSFGQVLKKIGLWLVHITEKGNENSFIVRRGGETILTLPVTVLALLLLFTFWVCLPLLVVGLFFGFQYTFRGPDLGRDDLNHVIHKASEMADGMKRDFHNPHKDEAADAEQDHE